MNVMGPKTQRPRRLPLCLPSRASAAPIILACSSWIRTRRRQPQLTKCGVSTDSALIHAARATRVRTTKTTENGDGPGEVVQPIASLLESDARFDMLTVSSIRDPTNATPTRQYDRSHVVVYGFGTHVGIFQTEVDLYGSGGQVNVFLDSVSSRTIDRRKLGAERYRDLGFLPTPTESIVLKNWKGQEPKPLAACIPP